MAKTVEIKENTQKVLDRFGLSALSKKNYKHAEAEEIMVEKDTGEFLIKSPDGYTVSYEALSREKSSIDTFTLLNYSLNMSGKMYKVNLDNLYLPESVEYERNVIDNEVMLKQKGMKRLLFHIDAHEQSVVDGRAVSTSYNPSVTVKIHGQKVNAPTNETYCFTFEVTKPLGELNSLVINIEDIIDEVPIYPYNIFLSKLVFHENKEEGGKNKKLIMNNLFITVD